MPLRHSQPRCHDAACPARHGCLRWLERETAWETTSHVATFRNGPPGPCSWWVDASTYDEALDEAADSDEDDDSDWDDHPSLSAAERNPSLR